MRLVAIHKVNRNIFRCDKYLTKHKVRIISSAMKCDIFPAVDVWTRESVEYELVTSVNVASNWFRTITENEKQRTTHSKRFVCLRLHFYFRGCEAGRSAKGQNSCALWRSCLQFLIISLRGITWTGSCLFIWFNKQRLCSITLIQRISFRVRRQTADVIVSHVSDSD